MLFCAWHMLAVSLYLMPETDATRALKNLTSPYVLLLSQWQQWNIFSPDPLRTSTAYRIEIKKDGKWEAVQVIDYAHLHWYERAKELKVLERLETNDWKMLMPSYLTSLCPSLPDAHGKMIRLIAASFELPAELQKLEHLSPRLMMTTERELGSVSCPS